MGADSTEAEHLGYASSVISMTLIIMGHLACRRNKENGILDEKTGNRTPPNSFPCPTVKNFYMYENRRPPGPFPRLSDEGLTCDGTSCLAALVGPPC